MPRAPVTDPALEEYADKRDFSLTREPRPQRRKSARALRFVVQKHEATRLHYDFRLELDGVLKSWAVPKGPSTDVGVRRLAIAVEDHPLDYRCFEGAIPKGEYGGGTVMIWDEGPYRDIGSNPDPQQGMRDGLEKGKVQVLLEGTRLRGVWTLVRAGRRDAEPSWLLIRHGPPQKGAHREAVDTLVQSVVSGRTTCQIADEAG